MNSTPIDDNTVHLARLKESGGRLLSDFLRDDEKIFNLYETMRNYSPEQYKQSKKMVVNLLRSSTHFSEKNIGIFKKSIDYLYKCAKAGYLPEFAQHIRDEVGHYQRGEKPTLPQESVRKDDCYHLVENLIYSMPLSLSDDYICDLYIAIHDDTQKKCSEKVNQQLTSKIMVALLSGSTNQIDHQRLEASHNYVYQQALCTQLTEFAQVIRAERKKIQETTTIIAGQPVETIPDYSPSFKYWSACNGEHMQRELYPTSILDEEIEIVPISKDEKEQHDQPSLVSLTSRIVEQQLINSIFAHESDNDGLSMDADDEKTSLL